MKDCCILSFSYLARFEADADRQLRLYLVAFLVVECDIYSLYDFSILAHLSLDRVLDLSSRDRFDLNANALRQRALRCADLHGHSAYCLLVGELRVCLLRFVSSRFFWILCQNSLCSLRICGSFFLCSCISRRCLVLNVRGLCLRLFRFRRCLCSRLRVRCRRFYLLRGRGRFRILLYNGSRIICSLISESVDRTRHICDYHCRAQKKCQKSLE